MAGGEAVITAGIGFSSAATAPDIVAAVRAAQDRTGCVVQALAVPGWKRGTPIVDAAAAQLGLPVAFVDRDALTAAQQRCPTRSDEALRATGLASVAEAAALAGGGRLLLPRIVQGGVTCALAGP